MRPPHARRIAAGLLAVGVTVTGCAFEGVSSLPLPGGADTGEHPYDIKVEFTNVLDLVPYSLCRVNDVAVGKVVKVELSGWHAVVTCKLRREVILPDNAIATISQTSLLGEKFVQLSAPSGEPPRGRLGQGDTIKLSRTSQAAEFEQVFSALSMLLNGAGLEQLSTITHELNQIMAGREDKIRDLLKQLETFVGGLDRQKAQIVRLIENLDRLAEKLAKEKDTIAGVIDRTQPALKILREQRKQLTKMLTGLDRLSDVAVRVVRRSSDDTLANLRSLQKILTNVAKAGDSIPRGLELAINFPFSKSSANAIRGDYANIHITLDLDMDVLLHNMTAGSRDPQDLLEPPNLLPPLPPLGSLPRRPGLEPIAPGDGVTPQPSATPSPSPSGLPGLDDLPVPGTSRAPLTGSDLDTLLLGDLT